MKINIRPISSITRGPRETPMELLRIIAIFMVLVVHADFVALGVPSSDFALSAAGFGGLLRVTLEMAAIVCVNIFILISGWFGIRPTVRGFMNFVFQVLFFLIISYLAMLAFGMAKFTGQNVASCFCLGPSQWFIKSYAALYLVAPLLNLFVGSVSERQLRLTVILFFFYQTFWGFLSPNTSVNDGYSVFSFMGLYLLARYMRLYYKGGRSRSWLGLYGLMTLLCIVSFYTFPSGLNVTSYANPLVIISALALTMYFTTLRMKQNEWINFIAASSFGAYLLHSAPTVMVHFRRAVTAVYAVTPGVLAVLTVFLVLVAFYAAAILLDQGRVWLWNRFGAVMTEGVEAAFLRVTDPSFLRDVDFRAVAAEKGRQAVAALRGIPVAIKKADFKGRAKSTGKVIKSKIQQTASRFSKKK